MARVLPCAVAFCLLLAAAGEAPGSVISVAGDAGDGTVDVNGLAGSLTSPMIRAGVGGNDQRGQGVVFFFALPAVPSPAAIVGAELDLTYLGISQFTVTVPPDFNGDLFGIGARATPTIQGTDYYDGNAALSSDTLLAAGIVTPATYPGTLTVSGASLLSFIQSLYQPDGTPIAPFVAFRVNPDADLPIGSAPYRGFEFASADNTNNAGANVPKLQLTVLDEQPPPSPVPEPSTFALFLGAIAVAAAGVGWQRRRNLLNPVRFG